MAATSISPIGFSRTRTRILRLTVLWAMSNIAGPIEGQVIDWSTVPLLNHSSVQAVNSDGSAAFSPNGQPFRLRGVLLNNPADMLDSTPNFIPWDDQNPPLFALGAQWQVFVQSTDPADRAGTAVYMAQNYGNFPFIADSAASYSDSEWLGELERINPGGTLQAGALVEIRARAGLPFAGKYNANEAHFNDPSADFEVIVLDMNFGMPEPLPIALADVKDSSDAFLFDSTRVSGAELYQARLVKLEGVRIADSTGWASDGYVTLTDDLGHTLPMHLGLNPDLAALAPPTGFFDVVGIFNQESFSGGQDGYELWVMRADAITAVPEANSLALLAGASLLGGWLIRRRAERGHQTAR